MEWIETHTFVLTQLVFLSFSFLMITMGLRYIVSAVATLWVTVNDCLYYKLWSFITSLWVLQILRFKFCEKAAKFFAKLHTVSSSGKIFIVLDSTKKKLPVTNISLAETEKKENQWTYTILVINAVIYLCKVQKKTQDMIRNKSWRRRKWNKRKKVCCTKLRETKMTNFFFSLIMPFCFLVLFRLRSFSLRRKGYCRRFSCLSRVKLVKVLIKRLVKPLWSEFWILWKIHLKMGEGWPSNPFNLDL